MKVVGGLTGAPNSRPTLLSQGCRWLWRDSGSRTRPFSPGNLCLELTRLLPSTDCSSKKGNPLDCLGNIQKRERHVECNS